MVLNRVVVVIGCLVLFACATDPGARLREANRTTPQILAERPAYPGYGAARGRQTLNWSHASFAEDFAKIMFETEWGGKQPKLLKWDERVEVAIASVELDAYRADIAEYVALLDANTPDLSVTLVSGPVGDITLRSAPAEEMVVSTPSIQCFITPVDMDWATFDEADSKGEINWEKVERIEKTTVFIPAFAAPFSIRGCIAEELIQALGPANDLYGLEDSLFNDDEAHIWPTAFDLKVLNILYSDSLVPGMNREMAVDAAKVALARTPDGAKQRDWTKASRLYHNEYHRYLTSDDEAARDTALTRAINFADLLPQYDHRRGEALRSQAFVARDDDDTKRAITTVEEAISIFRQGLPEDSPRLARALVDYAFYLYFDDQYEKALTVVEEALPILAAHAAEERFVSSLRLKAYAHLLLDNQIEAQSAARETIAWARYAYGADSARVRKWSEDFRGHDIYF